MTAQQFEANLKDSLVRCESCGAIVEEEECTRVFPGWAAGSTICDLCFIGEDAPELDSSTSSVKMVEDMVPHFYGPTVELH